jgi:hypothetical protein
LTQLLRFPHGLLRRHLSTLERLIVSAGLAGVVYSLVSNLPAYPPYWDIVITVVVFGLTLWSPAAGYLLAVVAMAYPIYHLSLYLAVLYLAVALLGIRIFANNLGATLLVLVAPWLPPFYLAWAVPLLGGLWWGTTAGAVMGGLAAFWGQVMAGMSGLDPDWLGRLGAAPSAAGIIERFAQADSLETLTRILKPLTPDSTVLLYYLLQVILWATVGGLVGSLSERPRVQQRRPWSTILVSWGGAAALLLAHAGLGLWLRLYTWQNLAVYWAPLLISFVLTALLIGILESLQDLLEHPLPTPRRRLERLRARQPVAKPSSTTLPSTSAVPVAADQEAGKDAGNPQAASKQAASTQPEDSDDLIMLELD